MTRCSSSVTIREVARQAGVSVATVSRYINRNAPVSAEVAERLNQVMTELRYVPHAAARHLASRKTRVIGLLLNNLHNDFFVPLLNGVEAVVRPIGPHNTDGPLIFSDGLVDEDLANLNAGGFPMVLVHRTAPLNLSVPRVTVENIEITRQLVEHLIQVHGKRRILFMRGPIPQKDAYRRELGYKSALAANGIPFDENLVLNGVFERDIAYEVLNDFLANGKTLDVFKVRLPDGTTKELALLKKSQKESAFVDPKNPDAGEITWQGSWLPLIVPAFFANAYDVFLLRQYFMTLPRELDESAMIDGARPLRVLWSVIILQSYPALMAITVFHIMWAWNDYFGPLSYPSTKPELQPVSVALSRFNGIYGSRPQLIQAGALMSLILPLILFAAAQRFFVQGIVITGVEK